MQLSLTVSLFSLQAEVGQAVAGAFFKLEQQVQVRTGNKLRTFYSLLLGLFMFQTKRLYPSPHRGSHARPLGSCFVESRDLPVNKLLEVGT